jgi:hypothetical protein
MGESCDEYSYSLLASSGDAELARNPWGPCSGAGNCSAGACTCEWPWTGLSDVVNSAGLDCSQNDLALWAANLCVTVVLSSFALRSFLLMRQDFGVMVERQRAQGRTLRLSDNRGLVAMYLYFVVIVPSLLAISVVRLLDVEQRIGVTAPMTVLYAVARSGFYAAVYAFQPGLLQAVLLGRRGNKIRRVLWLADRTYLYSGLWVSVLSSLPLFLLGVEDGVAPVRLVVWHVLNGGSALAMLLSLPLIFYINRRVQRALARSLKLYPSERAALAKQRLGRMERVAFLVTLVNLGAYAMLAVLPALGNKMDYWVPVSFMMYSAIGLSLANTVTTDEDVARFSARRATSGSQRWGDALRHSFRSDANALPDGDRAASGEKSDTSDKSDGHSKTSKSKSSSNAARHSDLEEGMAIGPKSVVPVKPRPPSRDARGSAARGADETDKADKADVADAAHTRPGQAPELPARTPKPERPLTPPAVEPLAALAAPHEDPEQALVEDESVFHALVGAVHTAVAKVHGKSVQSPAQAQARTVAVSEVWFPGVDLTPRQRAKAPAPVRHMVFRLDDDCDDDDDDKARDAKQP